MHKNEVHSAFEILLEEVEAVADALRDDGADAFKGNDLEKAQRLIESATRLEDFRKRLKDMQKEWQTLFADKSPKKRKKQHKIKRGLRTPDESFRAPILQTLIELGGSSPMAEVLSIVEKKMKGILNKYDYDPLSSYPNQPRWKNTAQWCRNTMVNEGLLKNDSPRGIWEITEIGRKALKA